MSRATALRRSPARVRPYSLTGGPPHRCRPLLVETFVAASDDPDAPADYRAGAPAGPPGGGPCPRGVPEARAVVELCRRLRTVAEIAALLRMPLGVVRVLLLELADEGRIRVFDSEHGTGRPDRALLERVRGGLHRL
ncbi:multi-component regulatory system-8 [Streptomyces eurocidicus]|uniref:Multi-component regulatory system-8 n=1 Tax=Streptomyces eurocidicus TaxID=66423 RepID=A0A2N8NR21_STREU|nr:DUF742 domain-containing protein [Streptomyces eurocidicus]MBB5116990.1 hypothetical protein [Streptomyces eurocidicus]MBF6052709.1 DUF742 domain-containing protein [Streptomyces eurocidicus]PNE31211.1 multi-component regulatory system-8 [Streptomyces eurocidicus]